VKIRHAVLLFSTSDTIVIVTGLFKTVVSLHRSSYSFISATFCLRSRQLAVQCSASIKGNFLRIVVVIVVNTLFGNVVTGQSCNF